MALNGEVSRLESPAGLVIVVREQGTTVTIETAGEWDLAGRDAARQAIAQALDGGPECVVLDLSGLEFIDSSGLHIAIELAQRLAAQNVRFVIIPGPRAVQRVFEITGVAERLPFVEQPRTPSRPTKPPSAQDGNRGTSSSAVPPTAPAAASPEAAGATPGSGTSQTEGQSKSPAHRRYVPTLLRDRNHLSAVLREFSNRKPARG